MGVNERVKDVPANALRAMFAGIGQLLGMADKLRGKSAPAPEAKTAAPQAPAAESAAPETVVAETPGPAASEAKPKAAAKPRTTAKPRTAAKPKAAAEPAAATTAAPAAGGHVKLLPPNAVPAAETVAAPAETVAEPAAAAAAAAEAPAADLPLANYDDLTVASLRARLRNLSADQLAELIDYEKAHAGRADVITMFERRIAKLAEG
jgi:hypothetical protein